LNILFFIVWKRINEFFVSKGIEAGLNFYFLFFGMMSQSDQA